MPKRKLSEAQAANASPRQTPKRHRHDKVNVELPASQSRRQGNGTAHAETPVPTPSRSFLKKHGTLNLLDGNATPRSLRKVLFTESQPQTPSDRRAKSKTNGAVSPVISPQEPIWPITNAQSKDRSARRKSTRRLIEDAENGGEDHDTGLDIADRVLDDDENIDDLVDDGTAQDAIDDIMSQVEQTPTKSRTKDASGKRATTPRKKPEREPTPPLHELAPHEQYFFQNRPASCKTSTNTLTSSSLLSHDDYNTHVNAIVDPHADAIAHLVSLHSHGFDQWTFELDQGFNICLFGYGSKRSLVDNFAAFLWHQTTDSDTADQHEETIVIVNGYAHLLALSDILTQLARAILPESTKLPAQTNALLSLLLETLNNPSQPQIYLLINSLDARPMRKPAIQSALARLATTPRLHLLATADTPHFNLMWDTSLRSQFRFLFHDTTTFLPYTAEIDVVDTVNALLGKSGRRIGGKDGVTYVLQSLPRKARDLFRILVVEQIAVLDAVPEATVEGDEPFEDMELDDLEHAQVEPQTPSRKKGRTSRKQKQSSAEGVEFRTLYHKAVEQFACSSEMDLRTLLKEFHDHQMIETRGAGQGSERLLVPFGREELEGLLQSLV